MKEKKVTRSKKEEAFFKAAKRIFHDEGVIEIDQDALVSMPEDESGAYVQAWVYVSCNDLL